MIKKKVGLLLLTSMSWLPADKLLAIGGHEGIEGGTGLKNSHEVFQSIYDPDVSVLEVILSYAMFPKKLDSLDDLNPFGHLALRVKTPQGGFQILSVNQKAVSGDGPLFLRLSPEEYFYGVGTSSSLIHGSNYGLAYARSSIGVQLKGLPYQATNRIWSEADHLDELHRNGDISFDAKQRNCAHFTRELLRAAGIELPGKGEAFPLNVFKQFSAYGRRKTQGDFETSYFFYQKVPSNHLYEYQNLPVSMSKDQILNFILTVTGFNTLPRHRMITTIVSANSDRTGLEVETVKSLRAVPKACNRVWFLPFSRAVLGKVFNE